MLYLVEFKGIVYDDAMKQNIRLQIDYRFIRSAFFPRWDKKSQWRVKEVWDLPSEGRCETEGKLIFIRPQTEKDKDTLYLLLIHEICHAIAPNHGDRWRKRMLKAANRAEELGRHGLSEMIRQDAVAYYLDRKSPAVEIYRQIGRMVQQSPQASYGSIIRYLAMENGLYRNEMVKKYKLCRKTYDMAIRSQRRMALKN